MSKNTRSFASVIVSSTPQTIVCSLQDSGGASTEVVRVRFVSGDYFDALGITPKTGRSFARGDTAVAVASHSFWTAKLHSDPQISSKALTIHGSELSIVGVAPEQFAGTGVPPQAPDLWILASAQSLAMPGVDWTHEGGPREWQVLARRGAGISAGQASAELRVLSATWPLEDGRPVQLRAQKATFFQTDGGAFSTFTTVCAILMAAVGLVLLIGIVNLTHLIGARNADRDQEIALRLALGASRWRIVRQFCTESLILGLAGGLAGLLLSMETCNWLGVKATELIQDITNGAMGVTLDLSADSRVLAWTTAVSVITGIAVGVLPALRASQRDMNSALKLGTAGGSGSAGIRRNRNLLLAVQVASCIVLLAGAALLFRGASRVAGINAGFDYRHIAVVGMDTRAFAGTATSRLDLQRQALARMQALPAVASVAWADRAPFLGTGSGSFRNEQGTALRCVFNRVSDEYFTTVGIPLLSGRGFTKQEIEQQPPLAIISESTARRLWPGQNAVGRRIVPDAEWLRDITGQESFTVIGVAKTVRSTYLSKEDEGYIYMPRRFK